VTSELNKVFGRDFIIGFFLPALFFSVATFFLAKFMWPGASWLDINWRKPLEDAAIFVLATWVFAVFLQSVNREIFRAAEGYWPWGLTGLLNRSQRKRFRKLKVKVDELYNKPGSLSEAEDQKLSKLSGRKATEYPSKMSLILPSSFGNTVRAYEDYSRVIYGFESINGWARLQGLMSKDFREVLGNDRARVDLWLNLCVLPVLFALEVAVVARIKEPSLAWLIVPLLIFAWLAYARARSSVQQFGEQVKAAFDIYLPALAAKLGYMLSSDTAKNRQFWKAFSQVMVYRDAGASDEMMKAGLERIPSSAQETRDAETSP
jgi:hypothetical protein